MSRTSSLRSFSARFGLAAAAGLWLLWASAAAGTESGRTGSPVQVELDRAKAAKKQAGEEKSRSYSSAVSGLATP